MIISDEKCDIFNYVKKLDWNAKRAYVSALKSESYIRKKRFNESTRNESIEYHLEVDGMMLQVCNNMFQAFRFKIECIIKHCNMAWCYRNNVSVCRRLYFGGPKCTSDKIPNIKRT